MQHLVLVDGHHLMYRAYYAIPKTLRTKAGEQTNAVFGVASMILAILKAEHPDAILFCFDKGEETFRHKEHKEYKEGRAETPDDFYMQIPRILDLLQAFTIPHVSDERYEADDFLGSYARQAEEKGMRVTVVTGDRDAFQLASGQTRVAIPHSGYQKAEYLGPAEILAKYGITPAQVTSYKGLTGDNSDNLAGVHGIGPKTAAALIQKYDSLKGIYEHLAEIAPTTRMKLERDQEQAFFCQRLATLLFDIHLPISLHDLSVKEFPTAAILAFFQECEFTVLAKRLQNLIVSDAYFKTHFAQVGSVVSGSKAGTSQLSLFV